MTTGPWDPLAARALGRAGRLRASDADREHVIDILKTAFVEGRLTKDELGMRAGQVLTSRTYAELNAITADIPARRIEAPPPPSPARARATKPINARAVAWGVLMIVLPAALGAAFLTYYGGFFVLFSLAFIGFTMTARP